MKPRDYWNSVAETKTFTTPFDAALFARYVPSLDAKILDFGCGYGRTLAELAQAGYRNLCGVDLSDKLIERGKRLFPTLDLRVSPPSTLDFPNASFDAVILFAVLTCVVDDAEQETLVAEARRVLRPGGVLYVNDFLLNDDERNRDRYERYRSATNGRSAFGTFALPDGATLCHHSEERVETLFRSFETAAFERRVFPTMNGHVSNGFAAVFRKPLY